MTLPLQFGLMMFFPVDFPGLRQTAERLGTTCYLTANAPGYPQEMLIDTLPNDEQIGDLFRKESVGDIREKVNDFLENAKTIISKSGPVTHLYNSLPEETKRDYQLLTDLAVFLLQAKFYKEANFYADLLFKNYGHAVGVIYYLAKGKAKHEQGELKVAEEFFKKAIGTKEFLAYVYLGELYWQQERYHKYIKVLKEYLKYTRRGDYLRGMASIAAAQEKLFLHEAAKQTLKDLTNIGRRLKTLSEPEQESLKQAESALAS